MTSACRVEIVGPPDSGKEELLRHLRQVQDAAVNLDWIAAEEPTPAADAVLFACPAQETGTPLRQHLAELSRQMRELSTLRGGACQAAGFPVFIVLTRAELLAEPKQSFQDWLELLETRKQQLSRLFLSLMGPGGTHGFGAARVFVWATAGRRPGLTPDKTRSEQPFGVQELARQVQSAVADHRQRQRRQERRLRWLLILSLASLAVLALTALGFFLAGSARSELWPEKPEPIWEPGELLVQGERLLDSSRRLISFEGYVQPSETEPRLSSSASTHFVVDWHRWSRDARQVLGEIPLLRSQLAAERIGETLSARLHAAEDDLAALLARAGALGLAPDNEAKSAWLRFPARTDEDWPKYRADLKTRLEAVDKSQAAAIFRPFPWEVPTGVVELYRQAARSSLENLLEPVRQEIRRRVMDLGQQQETVEAWRALAEGWLSNQAEAELYEWRQFALLLAKLSGEAEPSDPLVELVSFLRQSEFKLPLDRVMLQLPARIVSGEQIIIGLRPIPAPLTIQITGTSGAVTVLELLPLTETARPSAVAGEYVFAAARNSPLSEGFLRVKPGERISARALLEDADGLKWELIWSPADSPSQIYMHTLLAQVPRLRPVQGAPSATAPIAFGARLRFLDPRAFDLPRLFPR
ncbi:MAG: hypothetical protein NZM31_10095 [Gemmatales bacterium]|nr:hypothetical protein [Gemmatales bacterium]MDW8387346.1 hypothetical protein [Gemmatales bacterium]